MLGIPFQLPHFWDSWLNCITLFLVLQNIVVADGQPPQYLHSVELQWLNISCKDNMYNLPFRTPAELFNYSGICDIVSIWHTQNLIIAYKILILDTLHEQCQCYTKRETIASRDTRNLADFYAQCQHPLQKFNVIIMYHNILFTSWWLRHV